MVNPSTIFTLTSEFRYKLATFVIEQYSTFPIKREFDKMGILDLKKLAEWFSMKWEFDKMGRFLNIFSKLEK